MGRHKEILQTIHDTYRMLAPIDKKWDGRNTHDGQMLMNDLNSILADATGQTNRDIHQLYSFNPPEEIPFKSGLRNLIE